MQNKTLLREQRSGGEGGRFIPALCHFLGTLILLSVIAVSVPLSVPRFLGYEIYSVISGSMEPELPLGSVVYVSAAEPRAVKPGDVIAFSSGEGVVTHRVVRNLFVESSFITKGDANDAEDINPVPYGALIGVVRYHFPEVGRLLMIYSSSVGKLYLLLLAACGVMFNVLGSRIRERRREREKHAPEAELLRQVDAIPEPEKKKTGGRARKRARRRRRIRRVLMVILLLIFLGSGGVVLEARHQYAVSDALYSAAASRFTLASTATADTAIPEDAEAEDTRPKVYAPIQVDFAAMQAVNPDIVGWIYCEDTLINYPVLQGEDNEYYLHRSYDREIRAAGSIFVEAANSRNFVDYNTIIYGHHMKNGSMFAGLENWEDQAYFDEHPIMWLLTPERDYEIVLVSAYTTSALSDTFTVFSAPGPELNNYVSKALAQSRVQSGVEPDSGARYVLLSTCAYVFDYARSVVHGMLVPADSAGGAPLRDNRQ